MRAKQRQNLHRLIRPKHIALIGGDDVATVIKECRRIGYKGALWPVNPNRQSISGISCFADVDALPEAPDAAFIAVPKEAAIKTLSTLEKLGAGGVVCYTAGFSELGNKGLCAEARLVKAAGDMALVGPNCYGLINFHDQTALWPFAHTGIHPGFGAAIITQSGMLSSDLIMSQRHLPLSFMVSAGNQAVLGLEDFIDIFLEEPHVRAIGLHIETIRDVEKFSAVAFQALKKNIPIVAIKTGVSKIGAQLTASHTGSLSGADEAFSALFNHLGICRVKTPSEFVETLKFFTIAGVPAGNKVAGFTCSGGGATMLADYGTPLGLEFIQPSQQAGKALQKLLPSTATVSNPLDYTTPIWGDSSRTLPVFNSVLEGGHDVAVIVQDYPASGLDESKPYYQADSESFMKACKAAKIPAAVCSTLPENLDSETRGYILQTGAAPMQGIDHCMRAISNAVKYGHDRILMLADPPPNVNIQLSPKGLHQQISEGKAKALISSAGVTVPPSCIISVDEAKSGCVRQVNIPFPLVAKASSSDIIHKTELGAVKLNILSKSDLMSAITTIDASVQKNAPKVHVDEYLIETMVPQPIVELMVSVRRDEKMGLILTIASGGTLTELLHDSTTVIVPALDSQINLAIDTLRVAPLLHGFRGGPEALRAPILRNIKALVCLMESRLDLIEIEINPMMIGSDWAICADAVVLKIQLD